MEFSRISIREALEHTGQALDVACRLHVRASDIGASTVANEMETAVGCLQLALEAVQRADNYLQQKAGLLPAQTPGRPPAE